jgi:putative NADH-flavin reductase
MLNIVVIGANRGVGRRLVERSLAEGHRVTAAVRNPASMNLRHERLRVLACDALDATSVSQAVAGQDAVFCTLGEKPGGPTTLYSTAARNVVQEMQANKVRRLVFLSNFGILGETASDVKGAVLLFLVRSMIRHTIVDHRRALEEIRAHALEWIVVRPLPLTDGPWTGRYRIAVDGIPDKPKGIARADVADFMLRQANGDEYLRRAPAIAC